MDLLNDLPKGNSPEITEQPYRDVIDYLQSVEETYFQYRVIPGLGLCALKEFLFTLGLVVGLDTVGYKRRYCYPRDFKSVSGAINDMLVWDGTGHPSGNWIKCKGDLGDIENPNFNQFL